MKVISNVGYGGVNRTNNWHVDNQGNVWHFEHIKRKDELNEKHLYEENKKAEKYTEKISEKQGVLYEKSILDSMMNEDNAETEKTESETEPGSESMSVSVGVNVGKTARKIAAAQTKEQLRMVISEIRNDMQVVKDGMEKGWCDETEMAKVEMLMSMAQNRMGQVEDREATPEEENMFAMASLM